MKPFGQWLNDCKPKEEEPEDITMECCVCGREMDPASYGMEPEDVDEDAEYYCGGSPRCCP